MKRPTIGFHPGFDELSAQADRPDTDAARSRVGRHVAGCAECRETVREIRALGDAVRASGSAGLSAGLWARIERDLDAAIEPASQVGAPVERVVTAHPAREGIAAGRASAPSRGTSTLVRRSATGFMLLVAVVAGAVALDSRNPLAAATPRRLQADRDHARPGAQIAFHYRPIPALADHPSLTVWTLRSDGRAEQWDRYLKRAGTLRRVSALEFTGTVSMPDSTLMAVFIVGDSTGNVIDRSELGAGGVPAAILAADSHGEPRLDAFVLALGGGRSSSDSATKSRWATQMRKLYPSAPETWILSAAYARRSVIGDIVKLFESRERQYYGWHDRLEHRTGLSEATETMMATLGWELMDTARAEFWTTRLMRDHPESPFAPSLWIDRYRDVPDDSAAIVLRAFEPIYTRPAEPQGRALERALMLADRSGDSALMRRWQLRVDPRGISGLLGRELAALANDSAAVAQLKVRLQAAMLDADSAENDGPTLWGYRRLFAWYERQRFATRLAALELIGGDAKGARTVLDSIAHDAEARPGCPLPETLRWRAEASRRLGLMADARADFAYVVVTGDWRARMLGDSARVLLGAAYTRASWDSALAAADVLKRKCWDASREARRRAGG